MQQTTPRISADRLGQYLTARPVNRKRILYDQKFLRDFLVSRNREAMATIVDYCLGRFDGSQRVSGLKRATDDPRLVEEGEAAAGETRTFDHVADLVEDFKRSLAGCLFHDERNDAASHTVLIAGVSVDLSPELHVTAVRDGRQVHGLVKFHVNRHGPLVNESGEYVATLLYSHLRESVGAECADPDLCMVVDVFAGHVISTPMSLRRRLAEIESACDEIAARWQTLEP